MFWLKQAGWAAILAAVLPAVVWAEEEKAKKADAAPAGQANADDVAKWTKQLDADNFADRQAASENLFTAGKAAIPALTEAATGESLEVTVRSIDLLQRFMESEDQSVKDAAKDGLEKIARSDKAGAARRAKQALHPEEDEQQQPQPMGGMNLGGLKIQIGGMPGGLGGANVKSVQMSNNNGVQEIDAQEGDRKVKISTAADGSIKMEVTDKENGKDVIKKFAAKNADELKKKAPKAYETYKEYAEGKNPAMGILQLGPGIGPLMGGAGGGMPALPGMPAAPAVPAVPAIPAMPGMPPQLGKIQGLAVDNDDLGDTLKNWNESLKSMSENFAPDTLSPEDKKELKSQIDELKKQLDKLNKRLQKPAEKPAK